MSIYYYLMKTVCEVAATCLKLHLGKAQIATVGTGNNKLPGPNLLT